MSAVDSDKERRGEPARFSRFGASSPVGSPNFATKKFPAAVYFRLCNIVNSTQNQQRQRDIRRCSEYSERCQAP